MLLTQASQESVFRLVWWSKVKNIRSTELSPLGSIKRKRGKLRTMVMLTKYLQEAKKPVALNIATQ
jgi:hypothetical protein